MSAVAFFLDGEWSSDHVWVHYRPLVRVFPCCRRPRRPAFVVDLHHGPEVLVQEDETFLFALEKIRDASQEGGPRFLRPLSKDMTSPRCSSRLLRPLNHQEWMWTSSCQLGKFVSSSVCSWPSLSASLPRRIKAILVNSHGGMHLLAEGAKKKASASCLRPEKKGIVGDAAVRGDWRLHNDLCDELKATGAGFQEKQVHVLTIGKRVLNTLTDVRRTDAGTWPIAGTAAGTRWQHVCMWSPALTARAWAVQQGRDVGGCWMHHCYRAIVLLGQVRIPEDLLCVWPQESAGNNSCHAWEIPERASCLQRVSGQGTRREDPRREEGEEAKAWWLIQNTEMEENLWNKHVSHLTPLRVNNGKQDNNYYLVVYPTLWMRYAYAHMSMRQGLGGSGWHTEILCFFRHFVFFFSPARIDLHKKTNEKHQKNTLRPKDSSSDQEVKFNLLSAMGAVRIRHSIREFATQSVILLILVWQAKMASIELWIRWCNAHGPPLNFQRRPILCTTLYRNLMQASNFGGTFDQLFLGIFIKVSQKMRPILCTTLYRNLMQVSNFGGTFDQLFLWIF